MVPNLESSRAEGGVRGSVQALSERADKQWEVQGAVQLPARAKG